METPAEIRDNFLDTIAHLKTVTEKVKQNSGNGKIFNFPDSHKLAEGLFLKAWTHWEEFIRSLLIIDLATTKKGRLAKEIKKFRTKNAPFRLAELILNHPDNPDKHVEWDYSNVKSRASTFLVAGHRFESTLPPSGELEKMKRIRNAIAHKSDKAWESFRKLVTESPFNLQTKQMRGLTVGRFLIAHKWLEKTVLQDALGFFEKNANHLVRKMELKLKH